MSLHYTLLGILKRRPLHGYALREIVKGYSWLHPMTRANVYPALRRLEEEGLIEHTKEEREGRLRKIYHLTEQGRAELADWLADPRVSRGVYRDPVLLKASLLSDETLPGARAWIENELVYCGRVTDQTEQLLASRGDELTPYTRRVLEHALDVARLRLRWFGDLLGDAMLASDVSEASPRASEPPATEVQTRKQADSPSRPARSEP